MSDLLQNTYLEKQQVADLVHQLFVQLAPQDVEQFYASYHSWALQQRIEHLRKRICTLHHQIAENTEHLQRVSPSPIAHAALAQLQAHGVDDIDLLDRMLARGDTWLDHTLQLLEQCERLQLIQGTYTQWCEHALEGAYNWVESIDDLDVPAHMPPFDEDTPKVADTEQVRPIAEVTEEQLLQKLMSEDETEKYPVLLHVTHSPKITRPLSASASETASIQPNPPEAITLEKKHMEPIALQKEIPDHSIAEAPTIVEEAPADRDAEEPIAIIQREEPKILIRETKNKPQRQRNWLQRFLTTVWQALP